MDGSGNAYVSGYTSSMNFPTASAYQGSNAGGDDAFVTKISVSGGALVYSTYLGGSGNDLGIGIAVDSLGNAYVTGYTQSTDFPTASAYQGSNAGTFDAFVTKISASGDNLIYSTYLGGGGNDYGFGMVVDGSGNAYVMGRTDSTDFPTTVSAYQDTNAGSLDAFVTKIRLNATPTANAGTDQTVDELTMVTLDGSGSNDPDGDPLTYTWVQLAGTPVSLNLSNPVHPTFTAPNVPRGGETLTFQLTVSDGCLTSDDSVNITIKDVNHPPVVDAGLDQAVQEGSPVTLDGSNSYDPDSDSLTYSWVQTAGTGVTLSDPVGTQTSFTAPLVGQAGETLTFELTVSDGLSDGTDTVNVIVENVNHCPTADAGDDQTRDEGSQVTLNGIESSDPDGDTLTYTWTQVSGIPVTLSDAHSPNPTFVAPPVSQRRRTGIPARCE